MASNRWRVLRSIAKGGALLTLAASLVSPGYLSTTVHAADFTGAVETKIIDGDDLPGQLGWAVDISGDTAVVGAPFDDSGRGSASVFVRSGDSWTLQVKLTAVSGAANDNFGWAVAVTGDTVVVGAPGYDVQRGIAYVFVRNGTDWTPQDQLIDLVGAHLDRFGNTVAISGDTVVVGAPGNAGKGAAYVFVRSGTAWTEPAKLVAGDGAADDLFGWDVAINGDTAVIGAPWDEGITGSAYVFVRSGAAWSEQQKLIAGDGATQDRFGNAVALSENTAILGAVGDEEFKGSTYVFVRSGTVWSEQQKLTASEGAVGDQFGISVAINGNSTVVGSSRDDSRKGSAYVFVKGSAVWIEQTKLIASDGAAEDVNSVPPVAGDGFGHAVAISEDAAVAGAPFDDANKGSAYVFSQPTPEAVVSATVTVQTISISASIPPGYPTSVDYGQIPLDTEAEPQSYSPGTYDYLRVMNNGNVAEDLLIKGADATAPGGGTWILADVPGADLYVHSFGVGQIPTSYSALSAMTGGPLATNVAVDGTVDFNLKIQTPTSSTVFGQYSTRVTIVATAQN